MKWSYIKSLKRAATAAELAAERADAFTRGTDAASGASSGNTVQLRINNGHGSYKLVTQAVEEGTSREDMVAMRSKKKSDKFC
jgi:hypothetical protein